MIQAILAGRKTVTRRVVRPKYKEDEGGFEVLTNMKTGERWLEKEWIPCSERLPEKGETVIACTLNGTFAGQYHDEGWYRENMFFYDSEILVKDVVAWQPLPEPYSDAQT